MPAEERLTSDEDLVLLPDERDTLPVDERRFCVVVEGRDALEEGRLDPEEERETLPEEREELPEDLEALLEDLEVLPEDLEALLEDERRFCVLTEEDGREALLEDDLETLEDDLETLPLGRLALEDDRETLPEERLAPPLYEERPALEDRETEDELLRLEAEDEARPPPLRDWARAVPEDNANAATTAATQAILTILFISAKIL